MISSFLTGYSQNDILSGDGVYLRPPSMGDFQQWQELRSVSRQFLQPWEPTWPEGELSRAAFRMRIKRYQQERRSGVSFPFFLFNAADNTLMGGINISNVRRGVSQVASLGYWMGEPYAGNGFMRRGTQRVLQFMFEDVKLHRMEAACLPQNVVSLALLKRVGFEEVGYARKYLYIDGKWQDHVLLACLDEDFLNSDTVPAPTEVDGDKSPLPVSGDVKPAL